MEGKVKKEKKIKINKQLKVIAHPFVSSYHHRVLIHSEFVPVG